MEIKPVKKKKEPNYPTLEFYVKNPEMLSRNIPESWMKNKYVATSIAAFILCGTPHSNGKSVTAAIEIIDKLNSDKTTNENNTTISDSMKVAPIFAHGDGSGSTGCIVMSPPVFISEDEAKSIIFDALAKENILFDTKNCPTLKFEAPQIANECLEKEEKMAKTTEVKITMDGYNADYNLAIQFMSSNDFSEFGYDFICSPSATHYDTKTAAELLRAELKKKGILNAAVFYDPLPSTEYGKSKAQEDAKQDLLMQVNDFIQWYKKEIISRQVNDFKQWIREEKINKQ